MVTPAGQFVDRRRIASVGGDTILACRTDLIGSITSFQKRLANKALFGHADQWRRPSMSVKVESRRPVVGQFEIQPAHPKRRQNASPALRAASKEC
jgi:hypothetical protein